MKRIFFLFLFLCLQTATAQTDKFTDLSQRFLRSAMEESGPAAWDLGLSGRETKNFGKYAISRRSDSLRTYWPDWSEKGLIRFRSTSENFRRELEKIRPEVEGWNHDLDDLKVAYSMMVARNNLARMWLKYDLRYQLPVVCASSLSSQLGAVLFSLENTHNAATVKSDAHKVLRRIPVFLSGCAESTINARLGGRSLSTDLLLWAKKTVVGPPHQTTHGILDSIDKITSRVGETNPLVRKSIKYFGQQLEEWSKDPKDKESILGETVYADRWKYGLARPESWYTVALEAKADLEKSSAELKNGIREIYAKDFKQKNLDGLDEVQMADAIIKAQTPLTINDALGTYQTKLERAVGLARSLFDLPADFTVHAVEAPPHIKGFGAAYKGSPIFGTEGTAGQFYVDDASGMDLHQNYAQQFITAHEVAPGHGLQFAMFQKLKDKLNPIYFLSGTSDARMGEYLSHENVEGWGLYSEFLAAEVFPEFYSKDELTFLEQSRAWRCARAYIEPLIQTGQMRREEAVQIFKTKVFLPQTPAENQTNSFFLSPGQRGSYYLGAGKIRALRADVLKISGKSQLSNPDYQEFHDNFFFYGAAPISLFREGFLNRYRAKLNQPLVAVSLLEIYPE